MKDWIMSIDTSKVMKLAAMCFIIIFFMFVSGVYLVAMVQFMKGIGGKKLILSVAELKTLGYITATVITLVFADYRWSRGQKLKYKNGS